MILVYLFLDLFFYNYTSFASCFFLLALFNKQPFYYIFFISIIFDIFFWHTSFIYPLLISILYLIVKIIKGTYQSTYSLLRTYLLLSGVFLIFSACFYQEWLIYLPGLILNLFILLIGAKIVRYFIK